jgi:hypothetical protein
MIQPTFIFWCSIRAHEAFRPDSHQQSAIFGDGTQPVLLEIGYKLPDVGQSKLRPMMVAAPGTVPYR